MLSIYLRLIWSYFKISIFGFGGGYAMLSLIRHEIVDPGWITEHTFTDIVAISQMTPGPIGINTATYIGYTATGGTILGSAVITLAVVLPSFFLVLYTSKFIQRHKDSMIIKGIFSGLRPVVVGLIGSAALLLMNSANFMPDGESVQLYISLAICAVAFVLAYFVKMHPILIIILAGLAGYIIY
jgi:chromate transporter